MFQLLYFSLNKRFCDNSLANCYYILIVEGIYGSGAGMNVCYIFCIVVCVNHNERGYKQTACKTQIIMSTHMLEVTSIVSNNF